MVDVGSGLGHLARVLACGYGLKVTSVEAADTHAPKAEKYDRYCEQLLTDFNLIKSTLVSNCCVHLQ